MKYKGYSIKLDLDQRKIRFDNGIDDNVININDTKATLKELESRVCKEIDKRVKYLTN